MGMEDIIQAAREENWELVDARIPEVCNDAAIQKQALQLLNDSNGNVRDLAASIFEKASKIPRGSKPILANVMAKDSNPYARYRAAFALAGHNAGTYKPEVIKVLKEARTDETVGEMAEKYLQRLK